MIKMGSKTVIAPFGLDVVRSEYHHGDCYSRLYQVRTVRLGPSSSKLSSICYEQRGTLALSHLRRTLVDFFLGRLSRAYKVVAGIYM
jgi:hypothetical protein